MGMTMKESMMKNQVFVFPPKKMNKSYHIYLNDKCLFKNLNEEEFNMIWNKLYTSYWKEEITYTEVQEMSVEDSTIFESSY